MLLHGRSAKHEESRSASKPISLCRQTRNQNKCLSYRILGSPDGPVDGMMKDKIPHQLCPFDCSFFLLLPPSLLLFICPSSKPRFSRYQTIQAKRQQHTHTAFFFPCRWPHVLLRDPHPNRGLYSVTLHYNTALVDNINNLRDMSYT